MNRAVMSRVRFGPENPANTGVSPHEFCRATNDVGAIAQRWCTAASSVGVRSGARKDPRDPGSGIRSPCGLVLDLGRFLVSLGAGRTCARGAAARGSRSAAPPPPRRTHRSWRLADAAHRADGPTPLVVVEPSPAPAVRAPQLGGRDPPCSTSGAWWGVAHTRNVHHRCTSVRAGRAQSGPPARSHRGAEGLGVVDSAAALWTRSVSTSGVR